MEMGGEILENLESEVCSLFGAKDQASGSK